MAATIGELCRGQVLELQHLFDVTRTEESYLSSIEGKTASLMATASRIGAMVSNVSADSLDALTQFGHHLGMCFQVVDDVLDVTRTEAELGKPAGNDVHEGVYTLPVIYAIARSEELRAARAQARVAAGTRGRADRDPEVIDASMTVAARTRRRRRGAGGATELDPTCATLRTLVDGLVHVELTACSVVHAPVDAWLAADLDAYMDCWADDMVIELPSGASRADRYRKLVQAGSRGRAGSFDVHHLAFDRATSRCRLDDPRSPRDACVDGAACRCASSAATIAGGASITSRPRPSARRTRSDAVPRRGRSRRGT